MEKKLKKKQNKKGYFFVLLFILIAVTIYPETFNKDDLLKSTGARAVGMGGAFVALADDYSSFFWNPAGLILTERININIFYDFIFKGQQLNYGVNYIHILPENMAVAASYMKNSYSQSKLENDLLYLSYSTFLDEKQLTAAGVNIKFLRSELKGYELYCSGTGIDMGFLYFPDFYEKKFRFGILLQDIDTTLSWNNNLKEKLPLLFKIGSLFKADEGFNINMDVDILHYGKEKNDKRIIHFGLEKWFFSKIIGNFGFRAGTTWKEATSPNFKLTFGFTYGRENFAFNYVYIPDFDYFGETHKVDFSYYLGEKVKAVYKEEIPVAKLEPEKLEGFLKILAEKFKTVELIPSTKYFSPNKDGKNDTVSFIIKNIPKENTDNVKLNLQILDKNNLIIRNFTADKISDAEFLWDGTSEQKTTVKDGNYTAVLKVIYKDSEIYQVSKVITVDTVAPVFDEKIYPKVFAPVPNSKIKNMEILISSKYRDINLWTLLIKDDAGNTIRKFSGTGYLDKLIWDGKDALENPAKDGKYRIILTMVDFAGNEYSISEIFTIDTYISSFKVDVKNKIFKIGKNNVNFLIDFKEPEKIKKFDLEILDDKNNVLKSFRNKGPGVKLITWDGTNEKNEYQKEGNFYKYKITVTQKNEIINEKEGFFQSAFPDFKEVGLKLTLAAIDFEQGSKEISVEEYAYLNQGADALKKYAKNYLLFIKGYATDYAGDPERNLKLSLDRIIAVKNYLVSSQDIPEENIYINAYGDGEYFDFVSKEEIQKSLRRVELELITK